jgi:hypothetical protein
MSPVVEARHPLNSRALCFRVMALPLILLVSGASADTVPDAAPTPGTILSPSEVVHGGEGLEPVKADASVRADMLVKGGTPRGPHRHRQLSSCGATCFSST